MDKQVYPPRGLSYFWFLNDACDPAHVRWQIDQFAKSKVACVSLHPRAGLQMPYGGDDWFRFVRETARLCADAGLQVWLYDEDPYPSGNAGGWITVEHPELRAQAIQRFTPPPQLKQGENWSFPTGKLLWVGLVPLAGEGQVIDLTSRVGILRQEWRVLDPWDSRWYYPDTPRFSCPRSETYVPEFALRLPAIPEGMSLQAFVAQPVGTDSIWGALPDTLNPTATALFIERTHERYKRELGDLFGGPITAIFTDEAKYFGGRPWTPALFDGFLQSYGYDLRARLYHLFDNHLTPEAMRARLDYRHWLLDRFQDAWLKPVGDWCRRNQLKLVGHISPEDDPVEQSNCITNLFPVIKHFDLAGLDLIIPAVGDARHPIINIGIVSASSVAQQTGKIGVMSESLACSGVDCTAEDGARILRWQTVMGLTTPVVHGHFSSTEGHRLIDAPPDWGPQGPRWPVFDALAGELAPVQERLLGATQDAPVAILWPIRSFNAQALGWQHEGGGLRGEVAQLLLGCLERQVGTHFLDEAELQRAELRGGQVTLGQARYSTIIVPGGLIWHRDTIERLLAWRQGGLTVHLAGAPAPWVDADSTVVPADLAALPATAPATVLAALPRLLPLTGEGQADLRCTVWRKAGQRFALLINLAREPRQAHLAGQAITLPPGQLVTLDLP